MMKLIAAAFAAIFAMPAFSAEAPIEGASGYIAMTVLCDRHSQIESILKAGQVSEDLAKAEYGRLNKEVGEYEGSASCQYIPRNGYVPVKFVKTVGYVENVNLFGAVREKVYITAVMWTGARGEYPGFFFSFQQLGKAGDPA